MDRRQFLQFSALAALAASAPGCSTATPRYVAPHAGRWPQRLLLKNAQIVDVERGVLRPETALLIDDGRIAALVSPDNPVGPAATVDLAGGFVTPGLINAHCHITLPCGVNFGPAMVFAYERQVERNAEECIKHGVTCVRDMLAVGPLMDKLKEKIARGEIVGPRILTCCALYEPGGYGSQISVWGNDPFIRAARNPAEARDGVKRGIDTGADFIKVFQQPERLFIPSTALPVMDTPTLTAVCDEARKQGVSVALHQTEHGGMRRGLESGVIDFQHVIRDAMLDDACHRRMKDQGGWSVPTLSAPFGLAHRMDGDPCWGRGYLPEVLALRDAWLPSLIRSYLEPDLATGSLDLYRRYRNPQSYTQRHLIPWPDPRHFTSAVVRGMANARQLYESGVPFGCGNDGGIPFVFPGAMALELMLLEHIGVSAAEGLKMATVNNARLFGLENELGSIEAGKAADLAVFTDNPLTRAAHLMQPAKVFQNGRLVFSKREA